VVYNRRGRVFGIGHRPYLDVEEFDVIGAVGFRLGGSSGWMSLICDRLIRRYAEFAIMFG
jgi:hypothetical protein